MSGNFDYKMGLAGQSNMVGWDQASGQTPATVSTFEWDGSIWKYWNETPFASLIPNFAKRLQEVYPVARLGFVQTAEGGKGVVDTWGISGSATYINSKTEFLSSGSIESIMFYAGETDIQNGVSKATFKTAFELMMSNFRSDLSSPALPFYVIKPYYGDYTAGANAEIRDGLDELESEGKIDIIGDAFDYQGGLIDAVHLSKVSQDLLGTASANEFKDLVTITPTYSEYTATFGTGGDYATLTLANTWLPNTANTDVRLLGVGNCTELAAISLSKTLNAFNLEIDLGGNTLTIGLNDYDYRQRDL